MFRADALLLAKLAGCAAEMPGPGYDLSRNSAALRPLAERLGAAVVLVSHLTKAATPNGKHCVLGSIAYVGAARANFLFVADPRDQTGRRVIMFDNGGNAAPLAAPLAYTIEDPTGQGPRIVWSDEPVAITVEEPLRPRAQTPGLQGDDPDLSDCEQWLRETLTQAGGRVRAAEIRRAGQEAGFGSTTLHRARGRVGVTARREGFGPGSKSYWQLRDESMHGSVSSIDSTPPPYIP